MALPPLPTAASIRTAAAPAKAFAVTVPIDLTRLFTGWGPLPAVVGTRDQTGGWDAAGQTRTVLLSDDSQAREQLTAYRPTQHFAYTVTPQRGILSLLARQAESEWWFFPQAGGGSEIWWTYTFTARAWWTWPLLLVVSLLWEQYMRQALRTLKAQLESPT